jgi:hypothetical protein
VQYSSRVGADESRFAIMVHAPQEPARESERLLSLVLRSAEKLRFLRHHELRFMTTARGAHGESFSLSLSFVVLRDALLPS